MYYAGDAADPSSVGGRDPSGSVGVGSQNSYYLTQGEHKHADEQDCNRISQREERDACNKQQQTEDGFWDFGESVKKHRENRCKYDDNCAVQRIQIPKQCGSKFPQTVL